MTVFETERLLLQLADLDDGPFICELLNSPGWTEHIGESGVSNKKEAKTYIVKVLRNSYDQYGYGLYKMVLKKDQIPIGICGLVRRDYLEHADIGIAVLPAYTRKGYAFEAIKGTMDFAATKLNMPKLLAITSPRNSASQKLLLKLGMKHMDTILDDKSSESLLYSN